MGVVGADVVFAHSSVGTPLQLIEKTVLSSSDIRSELDLTGSWDYRHNRQDRRSPPPSFPPPPPPVAGMSLVIPVFHDYEDVDDFYESPYAALKKQEYEHIYASLSSYEKVHIYDIPPDVENIYDTPMDALPVTA